MFLFCSLSNKIEHYENCNSFQCCFKWLLMWIYMWIVIQAFLWQLLHPQLYIISSLTHCRYHPSPELGLMCTSVTDTHYCPARHPLTHRTNSLTIFCCPPHLPPIGPLEQTRWIRGRIARRSLRIAKVLVVTAESWGRFRQTEGTHGPLRWPSPKMGNFSGTRLRLSHRGFQMKGLFNRLEPFRCLLTVLLLFVLNNCVLKAQRDNWALAIPLDTQP